MREFDVVVNTKGGTTYYFIEDACTDFSAGNQIVGRINQHGGLFINAKRRRDPRVWINKSYIKTIAIREVTS